MLFLSWHSQSAVRTLVMVVIIIKQMHILMFYLCCQQHRHHCSSIFASLFLPALATVMRMMRKKPRVHTAATGSTTANSTPETNVKFKENKGTRFSLAETCWCYRSSRQSVKINVEAGAYWTEICLVLRSWWGHRWGDPDRGLLSLLLSYWSSYNSEKEWCSWEKSKMMHFLLSTHS